MSADAPAKPPVEDSESTAPTSKERKKAEKRIGDYIIGKKLGSGLTSTVRIGKHVSSGRLVALKLLKMDKLSSEPKYMRTMKSEIGALEKIKHDHVLELIKAEWDAVVSCPTSSTTKPQPVMVLELATNGELMDYLMYSGSFSEEVGRTYFFQLLSALKACHDKGLCHRDLKPENLLLDANFKLKIADFGFSSEAEVMHTYTGTKSYMAPEILGVIEGKTTSYTKKCDMWASGVILFIMRVGFPPYQKPGDWWFKALSQSRHQLFWKAHETHQGPYSDNFKEIINSLLEPDTLKRATAADALASKWMKGGKILDQKELVKELRRKKPIVDEAKNLDHLNTKSTTYSDSRGMRALEFSSSSGMYTPRMTRVRIEDFLDVKSLPSPVEYNSSAVIKCYTKIECAFQPQNLLGRLLALLSDMGSGVKYKRRDYDIEVTVKDAAGTVELGCEVYACNTNAKSKSSASSGGADAAAGDAAIAGGSIVLFRRLAGPWKEFRSVFGYFKKRLS